MLQRLYDLILFFKEYLVLSACVVVSLILLALNDNTQVKHVRTAATVIFGVVQDKLSFIPAYFGLRGENEVLRRINIELADEAAQLREAKLENIRLRQLVGLRSTSKYPLIAARVVGKNLTLLRNTITLNVGSADGVQAQMPVVTDQGLAGIVVSVSDHYAIANLLLNVDLRASGKVQRSRVDGIVAWDGTSLILKNITKTLDVKTGDVVMTSEYSRSYPAGIHIGVVTSTKDVPASMFKDVILIPRVDFVKLEEVFVLSYASSEERTTLEQHPPTKSLR